MKKRILSLILLCAMLLTAIPMVILPAAAAETDTFTPVTRFVLVSDIHVARSAGTNAGINVDHMMNRLYAYLDEKNDNVLPSAVVSMGDSLNDGYPEEADYLAARFNKAKAGFLEKYGVNLPIYALMGNHEYNNGYYYDVAMGLSRPASYEYVPKTEDMTVDEYVLLNNAAFADAFIDKLYGTETGEDGKGNVGAIDNNTINFHKVIGGMHFIGVSISNHLGNLSVETLNWLDAELAKATAATPNAPIFLFSHHPLRDTVHSTVYTPGGQPGWSHYMPDNESWGLSYHNQTHTMFTNIINKYPNVIFSTGHTHAPGNAPLAIWQGEDADGNGTGFTAFCPGGLVSSRDFAIIEIDANNTVRLYPQHVDGAYTNPDGTPLYFEIDYYQDGTHSYGYNDSVRTPVTPEFAATDAAAFANMWASDGKVTGTLSFPQAIAGDVWATSYEVAFVPQDGTTTVYTTVDAATFKRTLAIPTTLYATDFVLEENKVYDVKITPINYFKGRGETRVMLTDLKTPTAELKVIPSHYTSVYTHPTSGTGVNDHTYSLTTGTVTFSPAWSVGAYNITNKAVYPYTKIVSNLHGVPTNQSSLQWSIGGMYLNSQDNRIIVGYAGNGYCSYVTYTAEKSGTLNLTIDNIKLREAGQVGKNAWAVVKNFSTVLSADNAAFVNWNAGTGSEDLATINPTWNVFAAQTITGYTIENIEVNQGDTISFVISRGSGSGDGICDVKMHVDYTQEKETVNYIYNNTFVQKPGTENYPTIDYDTLIKDDTYPHYALVQNPNWELGVYYFGTGGTSITPGRNPYNVYTSQYKLITRNGVDIWGYGGGYYNSNFTIPSQNNYATYVAYVAEKDGVLDVEIDDLKFKYANTAYAIVKNFSEILTGTSGATLANWTEATRDHWEYSVAAGTTTRASASKISVKKGDTIAIIFDRANLGNGDGFYDLNMTVKYRKEYVGETVSYEHKTNGKNFPLTGRDAGGFPILATGKLDYEMGTYDLTTGKAYPYGTATDKYGIIFSQALAGYWTFGGMYSDGKMILPDANINNYIAYVSYTSDCDGKVDLNLSGLTFQREGTAFTVVRNFKDVLVANGGTLTSYTEETSGRWFHSALNQTYSLVVRDIEVKAGDTVAIVFNTGRATNEGMNPGLSAAENNRGPQSMSIDIQYTERYASIYTSNVSDVINETVKGKTTATIDWSNSAWTPIVYKNRGDAGVAAKALLLDTYYAACGTYVAADYAFEVTGNDSLSQSYAMLANGNNVHWSQRAGALVITGNSAAGFRYTAEKSGNIRFAFDIAGVTSSYAGTKETVMGYAIFVNGVKVWPYGDNQWYNLRQESRSVDYTEELNAAMPQSLFVAEGDCVEILCRNDNGLNAGWDNRGNIFLPKVTYDTETQISASLNDKFAITLHPAGTLGEQTATLDGAAVTPVLNVDGTYTLAGIAAKQLGDAIVWNYAYADTAFARGDGNVTVPHVAQAWTGSYADLMETYIALYGEDTSDLAKTITNLAAATLNYGAAAQTYFGYKTGSLVNASLSEEQKAITTTGEYENMLSVVTKLEGATVTPDAITLLLEDAISMKLLVKGAAGLSGYQVQFKCGDKIKLVDLVPCEDSVGQYKGILTGLTPAQWNNVYEIVVLDENGATVSSTISYSVPTYALRMAGDATTKAVTDKMLALYEMAIAYRDALAN